MGHYQHRKSPLPAYFCIVKRPWIPSRGNKTPSSNCSQCKLHYRFQWLECEGCSDALYSTELPKKEMDSQAANWVFVLCSLRTTKCTFHSMKNSGLIFWWWMEQHQPGIPEKRTRNTELFGNFLPGISFSFDFPTEIFQVFRLKGSLFGNLTISGFSGNSLCSSFEILRILG